MMSEAHEDETQPNKDLAGKQTHNLRKGIWIYQIIEA